MARIDGDNGNNLEIGTPEADLIRGLGGIDLLRGASGNDTGAPVLTLCTATRETTPSRGVPATT